jgi:hypothetical protein
MVVRLMVAETVSLLLRPARRLLRMSRIGLQNVVVLALLSGSVLAQAAGQSFKIEEAGPPPAEVPDNVRKGLEKDGIRLSRTVNGIDFPLAELWPVKNVTVRPSGKTPGGAAYRQLTPGKPLAVLYLPGTILDFKLQKVSQGFYLLRYVRLDSDTAEHGIDTGERETDDEGKPNNAQYREYVSLARLESGKKSGADPASGKVIELSTQGLTGQKTALLALPPLNPAYKMFPYAVSDDRGHCAVQFKLSIRLASGRTDEIGIAILLVNPPNLSEED